MRQTSLATALGLIGALAVVPAFAQTANSSANTAQHNTAAGSSGASSATAGNTSGWITKPGQNQWLASHLKGLNVYNAQNQKISTIDELIMDQSGNVQAVVLDVGGFLGMGVRRVAVPFRQLTFVETPLNRTASNNDNRAPANAPAMNTASSNTAASTAASSNAPGSPTANSAASTALGGPAATGANVNRTDNTGAVTSTAASTANGRRNDNWPDHAVLNMTQDQLKNAPEFKYNS